MWVPNLCTCGFPIGDVAFAFLARRAKMLERELKERKVTPAQAQVDPDIKIEMKSVFEQLGIHFDCCRTTLLTTMIFSDHY